MPNIEFGLDTFGDVTAGPDGQPQSHAKVIREVIEQATLADQLGIEAFGVGEHHRPDFAISAPEVVLGAIAGRTKRILLGSAVTVLSSDDPVRVFERFSTLNAASSGRAEITVGRGSFTEFIPAVRLRYEAIRATFRREARTVRRPSAKRDGDLERHDPLVADQPARFSPDRKRAAQNLDRRRRQSGVRSCARRITICR